MINTGWKGPFVQASLHHILLSGGVEFTPEAWEKLLAAQGVALEKKASSETTEKEGEEADSTEKQDPNPSEDLQQDPSVQPSETEGAKVGLESETERPEETIEEDPFYPSPLPRPSKAEKLKRKKTWKKGQALRAIVTKVKKGSGRKKKGLSKEQKAAAREYKRQARAEGTKQKPFGRRTVRYTACRSMTILPNYLDTTFMVHNGKGFDAVTITETMVGHKLGEFAITRRTRHNLNRKKSKLTIRKKETVESTGYGPISLSRMSGWSMDSTETA